ncbi:MAG: acyltransferase family protein [Tissierellia bacterium]|nr:acyltransferase family protein [Tissierellia bacterium]
MNKAYKEIKSFTGLRGLALLAIILYYTFPGVIPGGQVGYTLIFTLLGYLWMRGYLLGPEERGLDQFLTSIKTYYPPLLALVLLVTLLTALFNTQALPWIRGGALASLVGLNNWMQVYQGFSYFEPLGQINPLSQLWAISLLMQIFFVGGLLRLGRRTQGRVLAISLLVFILTLISLGRMIWLYDMEEDPTRVFYGTDTRFFSFGIGVIFGLLGTQGLGNRSHQDKDMVCGVLLIILVLAMFFMGSGPLLYLGGMFLLSLVTGGLLLFISKDDNACAQLLSGGPLHYLGRRSYHYYLWYFPLFEGARVLLSGLNIGPGITLLILLVPLLVLGEASSLLLEGNDFEKKAWLGSFLVLGLTLGLSWLGQPALSPTDIQSHQLKLQKAERNQEKERLERAKKEEEKREQGPGAWEDYQPPAELSAQVELVNAQYPAYSLSNEDLGQLQETYGFFVGDSVTADNKKYYQTLMPEVSVDGQIGRQMYQAPDLVKYGESGLISANSPIILQLGTNADFDMEALNKVILAANDQVLILVNVVTQDPWQDSVNDKLAQAAQANDRVFLVDWHGQAAGQEDLFTEDGTHLSPSGQRLLSQMIAKTVLEAKLDVDGQKKPQEDQAPQEPEQGEARS